MEFQEEKNELPEEEVQQDPPAQKSSADKTRRTVVSYLHDLVFLLGIVLLTFLLLFRVVVVSGPSMQNTLVDGDYLLLLNNVFYHNPKYGDVIVAAKDSFRGGEPIIKRVIATEGQWVDIDFQSGIVYVDQKPLDEPYTKSGTRLPEGMTFPLQVAEGCVFVMGDNRMNSKDSRDPEIGLIDKREILGKAFFLVFPGISSDTDSRQFSRLGGVH